MRMSRAPQQLDAFANALPKELATGSLLRKSEHVVHMAPNRALSALDRKVYTVLLWCAYPRLLSCASHRVDLAQIAAFLGRVGNHREDILHALRTLRRTDIEANFLSDDPRERGDYSMLSGLTELRNGSVEFSFDPQLCKLLYQPQRYAAIALDLEMQLQGKGSIALWEVVSLHLYRLGSKAEVSTRVYSIDDLRRLFGFQNEYQEWKRLRDRVIKGACEEITENGLVELDFEPERRGRRVIGVRFVIRRVASQASLQEVESVRVRDSRAYKRLMAYGYADADVCRWFEELPTGVVEEKLDELEQGGFEKRAVKKRAAYLFTAMNQFTDEQRAGGAHGPAYERECAAAATKAGRRQRERYGALMAQFRRAQTATHRHTVVQDEQKFAEYTEGLAAALREAKVADAERVAAGELECTGRAEAALLRYTLSLYDEPQLFSCWLMFVRDNGGDAGDAMMYWQHDEVRDLLGLARSA